MRPTYRLTDEGGGSGWYKDGNGPVKDSTIHTICFIVWIVIMSIYLLVTDDFEIISALILCGISILMIVIDGILCNKIGYNLDYEGCVAQA